MLLSLCVCIYGQLEPELECIKFSRTQRVAKMGEIDLWEESKSKSLTRVEAGAKSDNESLIRLCSRMKAKITMQQSDGKKINEIFGTMLLNKFYCHVRLNH